MRLGLVPEEKWRKKIFRRKWSEENGCSTTIFKPADLRDSQIAAGNLRLRAACRALGVGEITAHGLRHSAATILNQVGKDLREIQELLRHKNIRTTVRYTHVGYEQTRQTAKALSDALE